MSSTDNITSVTTPTFTGTAEAGSTVTLFDGATVIGTGVASAAGDWSIVASPLPDGKHSITVKAADALGNISVASANLAVTVDTLAPTAPVISGGSASTLTGTGEAKTTVTILDGSTTLGTATVGAGGKWTWTFAAGTYAGIVTAVGSDKAGNVGYHEQPGDPWGQRNGDADQYRG